MLERLSDFTNEYLMAFRMPEISILDVVEMIILAVLVYQAMLWIKNTRAWSFLKGVTVVLIFLAIAVMCDMTTIVWIAKNLLTLVAVAVIVALQPEIRRAVEEVGQRSFLTMMLPFGAKETEGRFSDTTLAEIVKASFEMGRARTGALIVLEQLTPLMEFEHTGIALDAIVSSQLLINIFEHNTPLHDGAVIIRGNRVVSATCYLPLSDTRTLSKELGTRHRAGLGMSETTDSMTIIVSEETGRVSVAYAGVLYQELNVDALREHLLKIQAKPIKENKKKFWKRKGKRTDNEK